MTRIHKLFCLFIILALASCSATKKANKSFEAGEYSDAIYQYEKALKPEDPETNFQLAEAYRKSNRMQEAEPYYLAAIDAGIEDEMAYYYYARALKSNDDPERANKVLEDYLKTAQNDAVIAMAERELNNLNQLPEIETRVNYFRVKNLEAINTQFAEYSPFYYGGKLYFTSNREGGKIYKGTGTPFTDIYVVNTRGANVDLTTLEELSPIINEPGVNLGSITMSKNGNTVIFAKGNNGKSSGADDVNLYFTRYRNGAWQTPRPLSVNGQDSWDSSPALSPDGTTLYFSSNREGGFGGLDIYTASLNRRGRWVDVRNMGDQINTPGNEVFPYVGGTGRLYFSSDGWPGFGGLDLFEATRAGGKVKLENLGIPINSNADDFGLFLFNPSRGFFTSNRKGGKGDDDIYTFVNDDPDLKIVNYWLSGTTLTYDDNGGLIPLSNTKVVLLDEDDGIVDEKYTQVDGKYRFRVFSEETYFLVAEKEQYFTTRIDFSTVGKSADKAQLKEMVTDVEFEIDLPLDQIVVDKPIVLNNIYYDLDKANIKPAAAAELDKLVTLMKDNPTINIELSSHTDVRSSHEYNMNLSQRRAQSAVNYIASKGIEGRRMVAKGYGETKLIIKGAKTEEEHQVNRRTEFKVTKYGKKFAKDLGDDYDETDRFFDDADDSQ
ncbi:OmpA family protein [Reichenbachiella carrageenanivorans]|uniref:OmpA family protein n=1 Tax=Reichenbachiella carrageenanivorans TaxID=2979869 RepID=A0ABY6D6D2_9BACT|nr:OmpA family protein [Reichenbachiella carrageenanivorans]UXX80703.1 OmpA family protein [Reichenbachiella carrageenanivorans]